MIVDGNGWKCHIVTYRGAAGPVSHDPRPDKRACKMHLAIIRTSLHRTRVITGELNKHRINHSLIYQLYSESGSPLTQRCSEWVIIRSHQLARSARAHWRSRFSVLVVRCVGSCITKKSGNRRRLASEERQSVNQTERGISVAYTHLLKCFFLAALIFCVTGVTKLSVGET